MTKDNLYARIEALEECLEMFLLEKPDNDHIKNIKPFCDCYSCAPVNRARKLLNRGNEASIN